MSYIINKTNGDLLTEVIDGTIDQVSTDLTLVGKNASSYGELFNENFIKLLENFANTSTPNRPQQGQLWYDTGDGRLKVYDGAGWKVSGGTIVANSLPSSFTRGDIWIDSLRQQMYYNDGTSSLLAGPIYTAQQGVSGFQVSDIIDTNNISHPVVFLYVGQVLLGLFSKNAFTPLKAITGYDTDNNRVPVKIGFNASNWAGVKFNVPATQADSLVSPTGEFKTTSSFLSATDTTTTGVGSLIIQNSVPLILGQSSSSQINVSSDKFSIESNASGQNFEIKSLISPENPTSFYINSTTKHVGIYTDAPQATLDVNGDMRVTGNLTVEGLTSTINSTNLVIEDKLIELGSASEVLSITGTVASNATTTTITGVSSVVGLIPGMALTQVVGPGNFGSNPIIISIDSTDEITITSGSANTSGTITFSAGGVTDVTADGGGILLHGTTDKTIAWTNSNDAWRSSENFNIAASKTYMINGFTVLSQNSLGSAINSAPGLSSVGTLTNLTVSNLYVANSTITYQNLNETNGTITFVPKGTGTVDVSSTRITSVGDPSADTDAVNLQTMNYAVKTAATSFSINQGSLSNSFIAANIVTLMMPVAEHQDDAICRVWCIDTETAKQFKLISGFWTFQFDL